MLIKRLLATFTIVAGIMGATTVPADAATPGNGKCEVDELCLYYNSNRTGSMRDFYTGVSNFSGYRFLSSGKGKGLPVKNNAASAWNRDTSYTARIHVNRNYTGAADDVRPRQWRNLGDTKNDNASFYWW